MTYDLNETIVNSMQYVGLDLKKKVGKSSNLLADVPQQLADSLGFIESNPIKGNLSTLFNCKQVRTEMLHLRGSLCGKFAE